MAKAKATTNDVTKDVVETVTEVQEVIEQAPIVEETNEAAVEQTKTGYEPEAKDKYHWLFFWLSFIIFPVGMILYFAFRPTNQKRSDACGSGSMWGLCFIICAGVIALIAYAIYAIIKTIGYNPYEDFE